MKISTRLFLVISAGYLIVAAAVVTMINYEMREQAFLEAESKASLILDHNLATHTYFSQQLKPKLFDWSKSFRSPEYFEPTWMSSTYAIREIEKYFQTLSPWKYYYKECAINARSPENEADPYERSFLKNLTVDPKLEVNSAIRVLNGKPYFVTLRRGEGMEASCLRCHSTPDQAPGDLLTLYGDQRSFHRQVGDVVQAISIRVPLEAAYAQANRFSLRLSGFFLIVLFCLYLGQMILSRRWVFNPLAAIRSKALQIANTPEHLGETIPVPQGKELQELTAAFNTMSTNLHENAQALQKSSESLMESLTKTVLALAATTEMRDPYTTGHQKRVAKLAGALAQEMGFSGDRIEGLRVMGLLHDIGNMVVPFEILSKAGKLSDYEHEIVKNHTHVGYEILREIDFPWPIAQAVLQHHERLDGSGYPSGLSGQEIIMEARILMVADVVDTITSDLPNRPGLGIDKALEEITKHKGILYDPEVVDVCLKLFNEKGFHLD
jgi:putative nucleotidyltransferase with HDIG domain